MIEVERFGNLEVTKHPNGSIDIERENNLWDAAKEGLTKDEAMALANFILKPRDKRK